VIVSGRIQGIALGCVTGFLLSCITGQSSALKPIDPAVLQTAVDATAKGLLIPFIPFSSVCTVLQKGQSPSISMSNMLSSVCMLLHQRRYWV